MGEVLCKEHAPDICWGEHLCSIYSNKDEQMAVAAPYVACGLRNNQRCFYSANEAGRENIRCALSDMGIDVNAYVDKGQLIIRSLEETYMPDGFFSVVGILDRIQNAHYEALRDGYTGLRGSGDLDGMGRNSPIAERLIQYEREINFLFIRNHFIGLCQYNETAVPADILAGVIYTHPRVIIHAKLYDNPFYVLPNMFNKPGARKYPQTGYAELKSRLTSGPGRQPFIK